MAPLKKKVAPLLRDTYLAMIKNSIGTKLFCNLYARVDGKKIDVMKRGDLSCAFFVSSLFVQERSDWQQTAVPNLPLNNDLVRLPCSPFSLLQKQRMEQWKAQ